jgi:hypothetical protein
MKNHNNIGHVSIFKESVLNWTSTIAPLIYILGIIIIIVLASYITYMDSSESITQTEQGQVNDTQQHQNVLKSSVSDLILKPIVESDINIFIFRIIFWLLLWTMVFLIIPIGLLPLKRFKLFNMEFEVDKAHKEYVINQFVNTSRSKAKIIKNITSEDTAFRLLHYQLNKTPFVDILKNLLEEINLAYQDINQSFSITLEKGGNHDKFNELEQNLLYQSKASNEAYFYTGQDKEPHYLAYFYKRFEHETYFCLLKSMETPFDPTDQYVIESFFNVVTLYAEANEYIVTDIDQQTEGA